MFFCFQCWSQLCFWFLVWGSGGRLSAGSCRGSSSCCSTACGRLRVVWFFSRRPCISAGPRWSCFCIFGYGRYSRCFRLGISGFRFSSRPVSSKPATLTSADLRADPGLSAYIEDISVPTSRVSVAIGKTIRPLMHEEGRPRSAVVPPAGSVCSPCDSQGSGVPPSRWFPVVSSQVDVSASDLVHVRPRPASIVDPRARSVPGTDPTGQFFVDPPVLVREVHTSVASSRTTVFPFPTGVFYSVPPGFAGFSLPGMAPPSRQPVSTLRRAVGFWCLLLLVPVFRNPWALVFLLVLFRLSRLRRLLRRSVTGRTFLMGSLRRLRFLCLLLLSWRSLVVSYLVSLRLRFLPTQIGFVLSRRRPCSYGALCAWSVSFSCRRFHASFGSSAESSTFLFFVSLCLGRGFSSL